MRARPSRAIGCRRGWSAFAERTRTSRSISVARNTTEVARAVQDGAADLGLVEGRVDADDLVQQAVARDRLALVVGPTHPWASRRSVKGPDLLAAEWVLREQGSGTRSEFEEVLTLWSLSTDKPNVRLALPSNEAVRMAVEAGAGATVISRLVAEPSLRAGNLPGDCVRAARTCVHGFAASRALFQQGGPGIAERDQRREIRQLRHAHAIDARRQSTPRTCRRRHFHRRGNLHQYRGATGASSTRSWRPTYAMEAKLCAWIDHAILARDHIGCGRCAGLFWYLGLALAPWRDPRQLALYARGRSSGQQAPGGDAAGIRERRDTRPG